MTDKFKSACVEYEKQRAAIVSISKALQEARADCHLVQLRPNTDYADHLRMAYEMAYKPEDPDHDYQKTFVHHDGDVEAYLSGVCPHCLAANHLVQARKAAKKLFGIAKRRISALVRSA